MPASSSSPNFLRDRVVPGVSLGNLALTALRFRVIREMVSGPLGFVGKTPIYLGHGD